MKISPFTDFAELKVEKSKIFYTENPICNFCLFEKNGYIINAKSGQIVTDTNRAFIENGILKIRFADEYLPIMSAVIRTEGQCAYCGRKLEQEKITVEHIMPKCRGGITGFKNIAAACNNCNNKKTFFTIEEFEVYKKLRENRDTHGAREYLKKCEKDMNSCKREGIFTKMPGVEVEKFEIEKIVVKQSLEISYNYSSKKERVERNHVAEYGRLRRPLVIDKNNILLESKQLYELAKDYNFTVVPVVILQDVECTET